MTEPIRKVRAYMPVSPALAEDIRSFNDAWEDRAQAEFDQWLRPWTAPDRNPMPKLVVFPWWDKAVTAGVEAKARIIAAWTALRYGVPEEEW